MRVLQQTTQTGSVWDCPAGRSNEERGTKGDKNCSGEIFHKCVSVKKNLSHLMQWLTLLCENQSRACSRCWILHFSSCEFNCIRCSKKKRKKPSLGQTQRETWKKRSEQPAFYCMFRMLMSVIATDYNRVVCIRQTRNDEEVTD